MKGTYAIRGGFNRPLLFTIPIIMTKGEVMLRDDAINEGLIKPTKEDLKRRGEPLPKPGPKPKEKAEEKESDVERMIKPK